MSMNSRSEWRTTVVKEDYHVMLHVTLSNNCFHNKQNFPEASQVYGQIGKSQNQLLRRGFSPDSPKPQPITLNPNLNPIP